VLTDLRKTRQGTESKYKSKKHFDAHTNGAATKDIGQSRNVVAYLVDACDDGSDRMGNAQRPVIKYLSNPVNK